MANHCREAAHFFVCVYIVLLGLSSIYLSVGFPCDPYADLTWDKDRGEPTDHMLQNAAGRKKSCWTECQAYALRLQFIRNPQLISNPTLALVQTLVQGTQPNPFCFTILLPSQSSLNPFCLQAPTTFVLTPGEDAHAQFKTKKKESKKIHSMVLGALCLDCGLVSCTIVLIYLSSYPKFYAYAITFFAALSFHISSLFYSSHVANWLTCVSQKQKICDGTEVITHRNKTYNVSLPDKPSSISNFEISIVIKNVNVVCIFLTGLLYFSMNRVYEGQRVGVDLPLVLPVEEFEGQRLDNDEENEPPEGD